MATEPAPAPAGDKPSSADKPGEGGSLLTGNPPAAEPKPEVVDPAAPPAKPAWMDQLTDDLKSVDGLTKFKTISDLGKSYVELEGKIGKMVTVPDEKASAEDVAAFRKRIGVPEKIEDYKVEKIDLPKGMSLDEARLNELREVAMREGVPAKAFGGMVKAYLASFAKDVEANLKIVKLSIDEAKQKLQADLKGDYEAVIALKDRAYAEFGAKIPGLTELMVSTGLGNHPLMTRMFAAIGKKMAESTFVDGSRGARTESDPAKILYPDQK